MRQFLGEWSFILWIKDGSDMNSGGKFKLSKNDLVYIGFAAATIRYSLASTSFLVIDYINSFFMFIAMFCMTCHIIVNKLTLKHFLMLTTALGISIIIYFSNAQNDDLIIFVLTAFALKDVDINYIIKIFTSIIFSVLIITILYSLITGENLGMYEAFRVTVGQEYRYTFGFSHPNAMHGMYFKFICGFVMILSKSSRRTQRIMYILLEIINGIIFSFTNSRTGFVVITLVILMAYFEEFAVRLFHRKAFLYVVIGTIIIIIFSTIFAVLNYGKYSVLAGIDSLITGRLSLAYRSFSKYPLSLFGTNVSAAREQLAFAIDCGIANAMFEYGLIVFIIFIGIYVIGVYIMWKQYNYTAMIMVMGVIVYSIAENMYTNIFMNVGLLLCLWYLVQKNQYYLNILGKLYKKVLKLVSLKTIRFSWTKDKIV